ncbi:MAG: putative nucleic acid-binding protein, contains PIN domain protein [halophilic archaeon J07HB67]|jgi:Predicted nucleic acid-binding protein, contains PIN domain|nr:MAG: putative nucleic acid-binding protein, contains PIN domain protein [halophilic archaeon J07HB67]
MQRALVDSNVLLGSRIEEDQHFPAGREIVRGIDTGDLPRVIVLEPVLKETLDLVLRKFSHHRATETLDALQHSRGFGIEIPTDTDFSDARRLFRQHEGLSLADATLVSYALRTNNEYLYSFDDDFDEPDGVTRLNAAVDPFVS